VNEFGVVRIFLAIQKQ